MTLAFRILLLVAAAALLVMVLYSIRSARLVIAGSLFWFFFAALLLGIQSPVNLVFLAVIGILVWRLLLMTVRLSSLSARLEELTQQIALDAHDAQHKTKQE